MRVSGKRTSVSWNCPVTVAMAAGASQTHADYAQPSALRIFRESSIRVSESMKCRPSTSQESGYVIDLQVVDEDAAWAVSGWTSILWLLHP